MGTVGGVVEIITSVSDSNVIFDEIDAEIVNAGIIGILSIVVQSYQ